MTKRKFAVSNSGFLTDDEDELSEVRAAKASARAARASLRLLRFDSDVVGANNNKVSVPSRSPSRDPVTAHDSIPSITTRPPCARKARSQKTLLVGNEEEGSLTTKSQCNSAETILENGSDTDDTVVMIEKAQLEELPMHTDVEAWNAIYEEVRHRAKRKKELLKFKESSASELSQKENLLVEPNESNVMVQPSSNYSPKKLDNVSSPQNDNTKFEEENEGINGAGQRGLVSETAEDKIAGIEVELQKTCDDLVLTKSLDAAQRTAPERRLPPSFEDTAVISPRPQPTSPVSFAALQGHINLLQLLSFPPPPPPPIESVHASVNALSENLKRTSSERNQGQSDAATAVEQTGKQKKGNEEGGKGLDEEKRKSENAKTLRKCEYENRRRHSRERHRFRSPTRSPRRRRTSDRHDRYSRSPEYRFGRYYDFKRHREHHQHCRGHWDRSEERRRNRSKDKRERRRTKSRSRSKSRTRASRKHTTGAADEAKKPMHTSSEKKKKRRSPSYSKSPASSSRDNGPEETMMSPERSRMACSYSKSPARSSRDQSLVEEAKKPLETSTENLSQLHQPVTICPSSKAEEIPEMPVFEEIDTLIYNNTWTKAGKKMKRDLERSNSCFCNSNGHDCSDDRCLNRAMLLECPAVCVPGCKNRRFSNKEYAAVEAFFTGAKKGWGVRAKEFIPKERFITEYIGEVVTTDEFKHRVTEYAKDPRHKHHYIFDLGKKLIDATVKGNCARFINHCCDPNAVCYKWAVPKTPRDVGRIGFFAKRDIEPGEEITFDYQFCNYGKSAQQCFCGATTCRGVIGEVINGGGSEEEDNAELLFEENEEDQEEKKRQRADAAFKNVTSILQMVSIPRQKMTKTANTMVRELMYLEDEETDLKRRVLSYLECSTDFCQVAKRSNLFDVFTMWISSPKWELHDIRLKTDVICLISNDDSIDRTTGWTLPFYEALVHIASMKQPDNVATEILVNTVATDENDDDLSAETFEESFAKLRKAALDLKNDTNIDEVKRSWSITKYKIPKKPLVLRTAAGEDAASSDTPETSKEDRHIRPRAISRDRFSRYDSRFAQPRPVFPINRKARASSAERDVRRFNGSPRRSFVNNRDMAYTYGKRKCGGGDFVEEFDSRNSLSEYGRSVRYMDYMEDQPVTKRGRPSFLSTPRTSDIQDIQCQAPPPSTPFFVDLPPPKLVNIPHLPSSTTRPFGTPLCASSSLSDRGTFNKNTHISGPKFKNPIFTPRPTDPEHFNFLSGTARTLDEKVDFYTTLNSELYKNYREALAKEICSMDIALPKRLNIVVKKTPSGVKEDSKDKKIGHHSSHLASKETKWRPIPGVSFDTTAPLTPFVQPDFSSFHKFPPGSRSRAQPTPAINFSTPAGYRSVLAETPRPTDRQQGFHNKDEKKYKKFRLAIENEVLPIVFSYLKHVATADDSKSRWLVKKIAGEMAKRESERSGFDYILHSANRVRVSSYANKYLDRKIVSEGAVDLWKGYDPHYAR